MEISEYQDFSYFYPLIDGSERVESSWNGREIVVSEKNRHSAQNEKVFSQKNKIFNLDTCAKNKLTSNVVFFDSFDPKYGSKKGEDAAAIAGVCALAGALCMIVPLPGFRFIGSALLGGALKQGIEALKEKSNANR